MLIEKSGTGMKRSNSRIEKSGTGIERSGTGISRLAGFALLMLLAIPAMAATSNFDIVVDSKGNISVSGMVDGAYVAGTGIARDGYAVIPLQAAGGHDATKNCVPMENQGGGCTDKGNSTGPAVPLPLVGDESINCVPPMENQGGGCTTPSSTGSATDFGDVSIASCVPMENQGGGCPKPNNSTGSATGDASTPNCEPMENQGGGCSGKAATPNVRDFMWGLVEVVLDGPETLAIVYKVEPDGTLSEVAVQQTR